MNQIEIKSYPFNRHPLMGKSKTIPGFPYSYGQYYETRCDLKIKEGQNNFIITGAYDLSINPLFVIDLDVDNSKTFNFDNFKEAMELPDTYTVRTPSGGYHLYYLLPIYETYEDIPNGKTAPNIKEEYLTSKIKERYPYLIGLKGIDLQCQGKIIFAPPTKWTEGKKLGEYKIINDSPLKIMPRDFVDEFDFGYRTTKKEEMITQILKTKREKHSRHVNKCIKNFYEESNQSIFKIEDIKPHLDIVRLWGFSGSGVHPIHGSTKGNGKNLHINETGQKWKCFHCNEPGSGGGALEAIAAIYFGVDCSDTTQYVYDNMQRILEKGNELI